MSLKAIRENLGLDQRQMGERIGRNAGGAPLHFTTVSKFERGQRGLDASLLPAAARAYGVRVSDIRWLDVPGDASEGDEKTEDEDRAA